MGVAVARGSIDDVEAAVSLHGARLPARARIAFATRPWRPITRPRSSRDRLELEQPAAVSTRAREPPRGRSTSRLRHELDELDRGAFARHLARSDRGRAPLRAAHQRLHASATAGRPSAARPSTRSSWITSFSGSMRRIVGAEQLERTSVALAALVDRDDAVEGAVLRARARESDLHHVSRRPPMLALRWRPSIGSRDCVGSRRSTAGAATGGKRGAEARRPRPGGSTAQARSRRALRSLRSEQRGQA